MFSDSEAKSRSYDVRAELAQLLGKASSTDFRCEVDVVLSDGQLDSYAVLVGTSNAGFRGIEGHFVRDGRRFTRSLGHVVEYQVID